MEILGRVSCRTLPQYRKLRPGRYFLYCGRVRHESLELVQNCATLAAPHCTSPGKVRFNFSSLSLSSLSLVSLSCLSLVYWGWPFTPRSLITSKQRQILTWNFQGMFLRVKEHHSTCQEWPSHTCVRSGTLNIVQVTTLLTGLVWKNPARKNPPEKPR